MKLIRRAVVRWVFREIVRLYRANASYRRLGYYGINDLSLVGDELTIIVTLPAPHEERR